MKSTLKWPCRFCNIETKSKRNRKWHEENCVTRILKLRASQEATNAALEGRYGTTEVK